jgi:hypothetical protein
MTFNNPGSSNHQNKFILSQNLKSSLQIGNISDVLEYFWVPASVWDELPSKDIVIGGYDSEENPLYVGR